MNERAADRAGASENFTRSQTNMEVTRREQVLEAGVTGKPWHEIAHELGISKRWANKCFSRYADDRTRLKRAKAINGRRRPAQNQRETSPGPAVPPPLRPEPRLPKDYFADDVHAKAEHGSAWMPSRAVVGSGCSAATGWLL